MNKKEQKKSIIPKGFKVYWIYALIFIFFMGMQIIGNESAHEIEWNESGPGVHFELIVNTTLLITKDVHICL